MIEMYHLEKEYDSNDKALSDINLLIERGEFVFLCGPSGAGKSTLLKLIIRELLPTRGMIKVFGRDLTRLRRNKVPYLRRNIGMIFQDFRLLDNRTAYDNVAFAMRVIGAHPRDIDRRVRQALEMVGLTAKARQRPANLSGGERQRVGVARAIVNQPALVLADEPTGNLDYDNAGIIMNLLREINLRGTTVVVATHAREFVEMMQKRVIFLEHGRIIDDYSRRGVLARVR